MELNFLNEQGKTVDVNEAVFVVNTMKLWCTRSWSLSRLMRVLVRVLSSPVKLCITPPRSPGARRARVVPALV